MITNQIRNFSIIAHIDHGKSTLADRMLDKTGTIPERLMRNQVLDKMDLERERGITIKMQPVRMKYQLNGTAYILNLIDTPGHIDFSYEVSRALKAVEGVILLVDSTQGIQAQTLTTLAAAEAQKCVIIPVVSKIDSPAARVDEIKAQLAARLNVSVDDVYGVSGKTGEGVSELLEAIVALVPPPRESISTTADEPRGLIFDFSYSTHRGVTVFTRVFDGSFKKGQPLSFSVAGKEFTALEVGTFSPAETPTETLSAGEIGYVVTGIKEPGIVAVGDTILSARGTLPALEGYHLPRPVVWASVYPESQDDLPLLRQSLERLRLSDSSLSFEEESSGVLGRGFRCGFLGLLHLEIITERLRREFGLKLVVTIPTISYVVTTTSGKSEVIYTPAKFPPYGEIAQIEEPWAKVIIITPPECMSPLVQLLYEHEALTVGTETYQDGRIEVTVDMPLRELMRGFFDKLKNVSSGYASLSYEITDERVADVVRLDILVAEESVPAFARVVARRRVQEEAEKMVEKLAAILPRQLFVTKIQAAAQGRTLSSKTLSALRKDVTGYLYGGDVTRKQKLLQKQKKGKKHRAQFDKNRVEIPESVFMKIIQDSNS
ncbi:elongation factor 4 [Candidatus Kaiserbacteria bacterium CG10_big_fil_rev_8_21_14_0_10_56_12]|uniref:Elongation factor 4 n=1 Tax=Candidatus Kaiserbacteria bacterium CG10_big_fil_rev_8_21_14_0_10_56_12 TaxID=1974611 RepID=A0A2H0UBY3_9BACT|nr:MAG: elongation factor 4 [Candidatus Kaiserbacteria bacterium CG10_big_fil_rev_8_21_14_0_10_56_12]